MKQQKIGDISAKDFYAFAFRCIGQALFPILLLSPLLIILQIFFYTPEDFWFITRWCFIYLITITGWIWLTSNKTIFAHTSETLFIIKKRCFIFESIQKQIPLKEIKQITFAKIKKASKKQSKLTQIFHMKLIYSLIYKLANLLLNKGRLSICIICNDTEKNITITDIKKNDKRYLYLKKLQKSLNINQPFNK